MVYGGFLEFEEYPGTELHHQAMALNSGRTALEHLIITRDIKKMYLPHLICDCVYQPNLKHGVDIHTYSVRSDLRPDESFLPQSLCDGEYLYIVNYYGQFSRKEIQHYQRKYKNIIVDNTHAYYQMPVDNIPTLYTCRKYFGVADGAFLYDDQHGHITYPPDFSYDRMRTFMGRYEKGPQEFYNDYVEYEKTFDDRPILAMSKLTRNILRSVDYDRVFRIRYDNMQTLHELLEHVNKIDVRVIGGGYMYPLLIDDGETVRQQLIEQEIFIPRLWPHVFSRCESGIDVDMVRNILPLPLDQRYRPEDMTYIANQVLNIIGNSH